MGSCSGCRVCDRVEVLWASADAVTLRIKTLEEEEMNGAC